MIIRFNSELHLEDFHMKKSGMLALLLSSIKSRILVSPRVFMTKLHINSQTIF